MKSTTLFVRTGSGRYRVAHEREVREASAEYVARELPGRNLRNPENAFGFLRETMSWRQAEIFAVVYMDAKHGVLEFREMFTGTITAASVWPREIAKRALELNACHVILAHNHPSGICEPSPQDIEITRRIAQALCLIECNVVDHIVVGLSDCVSMAVRGITWEQVK
jgi:DNA repair protein RadC